MRFEVGASIVTQYPSLEYENVPRYPKVLSLARNEEISGAMGGSMSNLSTSQSRASDSRRVVTKLTSTSVEMGFHIHGFHHWVTPGLR